MDELLERFEKEFREYVEASIRYCELNDWEEPLNFDDEIRWVRNWIKNNTTI